MKKIPSVFQRNYETDRLVRDEVTPGCEWVLAGEGVPTRKWDGTACMIKGGVLYKRYDAKHGKIPPPGFLPAQDPDPVTGHWPGWLMVGPGPEDKYFREASHLLLNTIEGSKILLDVNSAEDGTFEAVGPKFNSNREGLKFHALVHHGADRIPEKVWLTPELGCLKSRSFEDIRIYLEAQHIEGIVFHHPDGRMAKVKRRDFGFKWPAK